MTLFFKELRLRLTAKKTPKPAGLDVFALLTQGSCHYREMVVGFC
jgi:hypothetical protein